MAGMQQTARGAAAPARTGTANPAAGGAMAGMDHSNMPGMQGGSAPAARPAAGGMPGMNMPSAGAGGRAVQPGGDPGMQKLQTLVAELVQDSVVQRRIRQDPELRDAWSDPQVRQEVLARP